MPSIAPTSEAPTTYLVTGASRGLGHGLVKTFLARPNNTVIAAVRTPDTATAKLSALPLGTNSKLIVVKIDSAVESDAAKAVEDLKTTHGIDKLDVVVANAGIGTHYGPIKDIEPSKFQEHYTVNTLGPLSLFQATHTLLSRSDNPRFLLVGSPNGSIAGIEKHYLPMGAYGASKAAAHFIVRMIHFEHKDITAWVVDPGFVQTDTGNTGARFFGMDEAPVTVEDSVKFIAGSIDKATKEEISGHWPSFFGGEVPW